MCGILKSMGGFYIDADLLAHQVMEYGQPAYTEIADIFGNVILSPEGNIDRKKLGDIVFRDLGKRKILEQIVHSKVILEFGRLTEKAQTQSGYIFIIWDAPLLAEAGMHVKCGMVLLVTASYSTKLSRIMLRDGITEERAKLRLHNQPSDDELYSRLIAGIGANRVKIIDNNESLQKLDYKTRMAVRGY